MSVVVRFAPSPTGFLHIGGARTALFNWLYARHHGGRFLLRIEDTDKARSTDAAKTAIVDGLDWLGLNWDGEIVYQSARFARHAEVAHALLAQGNAYRCYCSPRELEEMREAARKAGQPVRYDGRWRDRTDWPEGPYAIRIKAPRDGETVIADLVQGEVKVANDQLDDMILLRADGTPTYMLSVVVDDHDMEITHVIRGDDHLTNAFRQTQIYRAMGWDVPHFAHIPLIHGADGAKLSKRHGALGVDAYRDMGYLPEAVRNYLLRLGWSHGDDEIIGTEDAIRWFDLDKVGRSPARFDFAKLDNLNAHYLKQTDDARLADLIEPRLVALVGRPLNEAARQRLLKGMNGLKQRARTLVELSENSRIYIESRPLTFDEKAGKLLTPAACALLADYRARTTTLDPWSQSALEQAARDLTSTAGIKLGDLAQPLRAAITGRGISPPIFEVMEVLGKNESLARLADAERRN
ncbi:MAG: glutamate--tRNA ligase [Alphaproteobacteria bacterium]